MLPPRRHASLALLLICLLAAACMSILPDPLSSELEAETNDRAVLEGNTETQIPATASDLHGYVTGFRDITTYVRFSMPQLGLSEFLRSTACPTALETADIRSEIQRVGSFTWWQPGSAVDYKWCDGIKEHLVQRVFMDLSDPNNVIVYIIASTR